MTALQPSFKEFLRTQKLRLAIYIGLLFIALSGAWNQTSFWTVLICAAIAGAGLVDSVYGYLSTIMIRQSKILLAMLKEKNKHG